MVRIFMNISVVVLCFALMCNSLQVEQKQKLFYVSNIMFWTRMIRIVMNISVVSLYCSLQATRCWMSKNKVYLFYISFCFSHPMQGLHLNDYNKRIIYS